MVKFILGTVLATIVFFFVWNILKRIFYKHFFSHFGTPQDKSKKNEPQKKERKIKWDAETIDFEEIKDHKQPK